jgi:hypothetical protein
MKIVLSICMIITGLLALAQQKDTLYIYDLYTDGDYNPRYSGDIIGGSRISFLFDNNVTVTIRTKPSGVQSKKLLARKAWTAGIMIVKPVNSTIKFFIQGTATIQGPLRGNRIIFVNDSLVIDTVRQGFQYYAPKYRWKSPLLSADYAESVSYVNQGTYFHDCFKRRKKRIRLLPLLQASIIWHYDSESGKLTKLR